MKQLISKNRLNPLHLFGRGLMGLFQFISSGASHYSLKSIWRIKGKAEDIFKILQNPSDLPRWWPSVYLKARSFGDRETGQFADFMTKGWLPYTLKWQAKTVESKVSKLLRIQAFGDLLGEGCWQLKQDGEYTNIFFSWKVTPEKPFLRQFSFLFKPVFIANHAWAMKMGEKSLQLEVLRRKAKNKSELAKIPAPPRGTTNADFIIAAAAIGLAGLFISSFFKDKSKA